MEEIIIDGVDVAGCDWLFNNVTCENEQLKHNCEGDNCYYKQLKRLEKENKMLQELKDEDSLRVVQLAKENSELKEYEYFYLDKYIDLKQALEEIREMASETGCLRFVEIVDEVLK